MVLHTIIDMDDIFYEENINSCCCKEIDSPHLEGGYSKNDMKTQRIISTNPSDYLTPKQTIGRNIN